MPDATDIDWSFRTIIRPGGERPVTVLFLRRFRRRFSVALYALLDLLRVILALMVLPGFSAMFLYS